MVEGVVQSACDSPQQIHHTQVLRANQEEVHLQGDEGYRDVRIIQSYPSKVGWGGFLLCLNVIPLSI